MIIVADAERQMPYFTGKVKEMALTNEIDEEKLIEAALAILSLTAHRDRAGLRAWKNIDWEIMNVFHEKGWISDPRSKAKSVVLTEAGEAKAEEFMQKHFGKNQ